MNNNFAALSRYLDKYPDEYKQYISVVNSYYFPLLLKIAQQQLPLFEDMDHQEFQETSDYGPDFSFNQKLSEFIISNDEAKTLDLLLDRMKELYTDKSESKLIDELIADFIKSPPDGASYGYGYGYSGHAPSSIFSMRQAMVKKYFDLFPDLRWSPEFQQLKLPFGDTIQVKPLGESPAEVNRRNDIIREKYDLLLNNEEAKDILENTNANSLSQLGYLSVNTLTRILKRELDKNAYEWNPEDLKDILDIYFGIDNKGKEQNYFREDVASLTLDIEEKWKELLSLFNQVNAIKLELDPGDFTPKPESEINNFNDSIFSSALYSVFLIKKISIRNIDIIPFKEIGYTRSGRLSKDLKFIKNNLENNKLDNDPFLDAQKKKELLYNEIYNCKNSIENYKKYKNLFKRLDKDILNECRQYLDAIDEKSKKIIDWVNKYRIDIIRNSYSSSIRSLASSLPSEAKNYTYSEEETVKAPSLYDIVYSKRANQKVLMSKIVGIISHQQHSLSVYIMNNIAKKILANLFIVNKNLFDQNYFEYPATLDDKNKISYPSSEKGVNYTNDQIKKFIQDWNGTPNPKSYLNVIFSNTKDTELLDKYMDAMFLDDPFNRIYLASLFHDFEENIINFISKSHSKTEDELIQSATSSLSEEFYYLMKKHVAEAIYNKFKDFNYVRDFNQDVKLRSNLTKHLAPTLSSSTFNKWASYSTDRDAIISGSIDSALSKIIKRLKNIYFDIDFDDLETKSKYKNIYDEISSQIPEGESLSKEDRYNIINNILNSISPIFSESNGRVVFRNLSTGPINMPIMAGGTFYFKSGPNAKKILKAIRRVNYNSLAYEIDGKEQVSSFSDIYGIIRPVSPTLEDFHGAISSLIEKENISNFEIDKDYKHSIDKIKILLNEMNLPWSDAYGDLAEKEKFKNIVYFYHLKRYNPDNLVSTIRSIVNEIKTVDSIYSFGVQSGLVAAAFGGIGFKDISAGIDALFAKNNLQNLSKKEFVSKISGMINNSFKPELEGNNATQELHIKSFLKTLIGSTYDNKFNDIVAPIIKKLNLKDFNTVIQICHQVVTFNKNFSKSDIARVLDDGLALDGMAAALAVERILNAAAFIHNHTALSQPYFRTIINSPNFYSDSKISQEYIESCTALFKYGGLDEFNNPDSNVYKIVEKMIVSDLISNVDQFKDNIKDFSQLCMNKDGIRSNLGNSTAEVKLNYLIKKIINAGNVSDQRIDINLSAHIPSWNTLTFEDRVVKLKDYVYMATNNGMDDEGWNTTLGRLYRSFNNQEFDREVNSIRQNASSEEQYAKDLKIKQIIQKASSNLKMLEMSDNLITYAKDAKKKDERLFNFEYNDPSNSFRFRVLRNLDPYHFLVGADTACCQRIGGVGHNAAVDSFVNPLAGVLLLEVNIDDSWVTAGQSYFHYVPKNNGLILDNVEVNYNNCSKFFNYKRYNINDLYAAFASYVKEKYSLSYVRCGAKHNKLNNERFTSSRIQGGDPRYFEYKKYSDFSASNHIDLIKPKFDLSIKF